MTHILLRLKLYLNETLSFQRRKRYKVILIYLFLQTLFLFPSIGLYFYLRSSIFVPVKQHLKFIEMHYSDLLGLLFSSIAFLILTWMSGLNAAAAAFCSEEWRQYCAKKQRPLCNRFFFYVFKNDRFKQANLEWYLFFFLLILCLIGAKGPESWHINANKKLMGHYGYAYCGRYHQQYETKSTLVFARESKFCSEKAPFEKE